MPLGGYLNQKGIAEGSGYKRLTLRGNTDAGEEMAEGQGRVKFSLTDSKQKVGADNGLIMNALESQPSVAVKSADGSYDGPRCLDACQRHRYRQHARRTIIRR